jgi:2'-hydroxyisoflavone reductase
VFVSAVAIYGDPQDRPVRETHPRVQPAPEDVIAVEGEMYGRLKVTCEDIVQEVYADRCTILRPQIVVGPHDPSGRYPYWVQRARLSGPMLAPGDGSDHLQVVDVRDLARFTRTVIENSLSGAFNLAGPRLTWTEFMSILGARDLVWVEAEKIKAAGVMEFELPLFRPERGPKSGLMDICNERARAAGLTLTDPEETYRTVEAWLRGRRIEPLLSNEREQRLLSGKTSGMK